MGTETSAEFHIDSNSHEIGGKYEHVNKINERLMKTQLEVFVRCYEVLKNEIVNLRRDSSSLSNFRSSDCTEL